MTPREKAEAVASMVLEALEYRNRPATFTTTPTNSLMIRTIFDGQPVNIVITPARK
jgi:hypothetical protein